MNILITDDEINILKTTSVALEMMGHKPFTAENSNQARRIIKNERIDAMFLDLMLGRENGLDFLDKLQAEKCDIPVIVFTAHSSIESAVESMKKGAYDYLPKPFGADELLLTVRKAEEREHLRKEVGRLRDQVRAAFVDDDPAWLEACWPRYRSVVTSALARLG